VYRHAGLRSNPLIANPADRRRGQAVHAPKRAASAKQAGRAGGFQRQFPALVAAALPPEAASKPVEIWFADEERVGQQGTITRVWAKRGCRPRALRDRRYEWVYLFGAICPERQTGAAIIMPQVNVEAMNEHLMDTQPV
jgi:hypothetical protein